MKKGASWAASGAPIRLDFRSTAMDSNKAGKGLRGALGAVFLPAAIFQIVLVGPGFSTGREVVEFAGIYGALGTWSLAVILIGFAVLCVIAFEVSRVTEAYNYRTYIRHLIGRAWPLFDVLWIVFMLVISGLVTSAGATVLADTFGVPELLAVFGILATAAVILFIGRRAIEAFDIAGSILFSVGISVFAVVVLLRRWDAVVDVFATTDTQHSESATPLAAAWAGGLYVAYNIPTMVPVLFALDRQTRRAHSVASGLLGAVLVFVPFTLTFLAIQAFYTSGITEEPIPWLVMFGAVGGGALATLFAVVFTYAVIDTSAATVHAFMDRVDDALTERGRPRMDRRRRGLAVAGVLIAAFVLSRVGVIGLVAQGYTWLAYGFGIVFVLPLVTRGSYLIWKASKSSPVPATATPPAIAD